MHPSPEIVLIVRRARWVIGIAAVLAGLGLGAGRAGAQGLPGAAPRASSPSTVAMTLAAVADGSWFVQGAYTVWTNGDASLTPFARYERFNTAYKYEELPPGLGIAPSATEGVTTVGLSYKIHPGVVFKADYQKFKVDNLRDRFNLGVGYAF